MVDEVFGGKAGVDEGTMNPTRLNSANKTSWLCERTMRSDKRMDEIDSKMAAMAEQQQTIVEQQQAMKAEMQANQELIMEQLRSMASHKSDP